MSVFVRNDSEEKSYLIVGVDNSSKDSSLFGLKEKATTYRYVLRPGESETYFFGSDDMIGIEEL